MVGLFTRVEGGVSFQYANSNTAPLSFSLPNGVDLGIEKPKNWLENLLPTRAEVLNELAAHHGIKKSKFELLKKLGRDVAGDVVLIPEDYNASEGSAVLVSQEGIASQIRRIKSGFGSALPPFGERMSLAGAQAKFSLVANGTDWYTSTLMMPSTHIFKPGPNELSNIEGAEAATLSLANISGVSAARATVLEFDGATTYATERFDRYTLGGRVMRMGMEDINQALGRRHGELYRTSFKGILNQLRDFGAPEEILFEWQKQLVFNVHIGNYDAHTKNYSIMQTPQGYRMSPLYDSIPLIQYHPRVSKDGLAMPINGKRFSPDITLSDWQMHASACGFSPYKFEMMVKKVVHSIRTNYDQTFSRYGIADEFRQSVMSASQGI